MFRGRWTEHDIISFDVKKNKIKKNKKGKRKPLKKNRKKGKEMKLFSLISDLFYYIKSTSQ